MAVQASSAIEASAHLDRAPVGAERYRAPDLRKQALVNADAAEADHLLKPDFGYWVRLSREFREPPWSQGNGRRWRCGGCTPFEFAGQAFEAEPRHLTDASAGRCSLLGLCEVALGGNWLKAHSPQHSPSREWPRKPHAKRASNPRLTNGHAAILMALVWAMGRAACRCSEWSPVRPPLVPRRGSLTESHAARAGPRPDASLAQWQFRWSAKCRNT
jgi:hypothetical protein